MDLERSSTFNCRKNTPPYTIRHLTSLCARGHTCRSKMHIHTLLRELTVYPLKATTAVLVGLTSKAHPITSFSTLFSATLESHVIRVPPAQMQHCCSKTRAGGPQLGSTQDLGRLAGDSQT
ncbi:hypothetical protein J6590_091627 [Homalodisca vitripennis]|nr:hypothetical protein J6590_091627 [Homalodisca vitripennis]